MPRLPTAAAGLLAGCAADLVVPDPRHHPVAWFGACASALERRLYADSRARGALFVLGSAGTVTALLGVAARPVRGRPLGRLAVTGVLTWTVLGGASLARAALALAAALERGQVEEARALVGHLCGRDPAVLDASGLARAAVESVAENTSDAVVAPLLWGASAGVPGLVGYRAVNTLDAMVGHRSPRYARFGWAAARLDDLVNLVPARVTALLVVLAAPLVGGSPREASAVVQRDGGDHPSPNAGHCEAAFAGALGVRLGGTNTYGGQVEHRAVLGHGRAPETADVARAVRLARAVGLLAALLAAGACAVRERGAR